MSGLSYRLPGGGGIVALAQRFRLNEDHISEPFIVNRVRGTFVADHGERAVGLM